MNTKVWQVTAADDKKRLDTFCHEQEPTFSRSFFQELIESANVTCNDKVITKAGFKVKEGDQITCLLHVPKTFCLEPVEVPLEILLEHPDFLIINKQAGLSVHPSPTNPEEITLVHGLLYRYPEFSAFESEERPGIVHRLDKNTSGVLIVARTVQAAAYFSALFKDRQVKKKYYAFVHGHPDKKGSITFGIGRDPVERHKMTHKNPQGKEALTHFEVVQYFTNEALVSVDIVTGRTHQIRVHMAAIGHPLIGDSTYGKASELLNRQALHAYYCSFIYNDVLYTVKAPLPEDLILLQQKLIPYQD